MKVIQTLNFQKIAADWKTNPNTAPEAQPSIEDDRSERGIEDEMRIIRRWRRKEEPKLPRGQSYQTGKDLPNIERSDQSLML